MIVLPILLVVIAYAVYDLKRSKPGLDKSIDSGSNARGVVLSIGRFEGRKYLRHPASFAGLAFVALGLMVLARGSDPPDLSRQFADFALLLFPLAGMTIVAVSLATLRARRDGTDELFASTPASEDARAGGHLLTAVWAMSAALICLGITLGVLYAAGAHGRPPVAELLAGPVLVGCAVAVGVTAARLFPTAVIGMIAVIAMGAFQGLVDHFSGPNTTRTSWFAPWVQTPEFIPGGWPRRSWSHLVYLVGLGLFAAVLGYLIRRPNKRKMVAMAAALSVIAIGGVAQSRPFPVSVYERSAAYVDQPVMTCRSQGNVEYCAYRELTQPWVDRWSAPVESVLRVVPASVRARHLRVVQRVSPLAIYHFPEPVLARLSPSTPKRAPDVWQPDGAIHPTQAWCRADPSCSLSLATQTAAWAVGLRLDPISEQWPDPYAPAVIQGYDSSGQARAVVALWLGAHSSPTARALFRARLARRADPAQYSGTRSGAFFVQGCEGVTEPGTQFGIEDGLFASQLLDLPGERVAQVVDANWDRLVNPRTSSAVMVQLFGLRRPEPEELKVHLAIC